MNVGELIEELNKYDPSLNVAYSNPDIPEDWYVVEKIFKGKGPPSNLNVIYFDPRCNDGRWDDDPDFVGLGYDAFSWA